MKKVLILSLMLGLFTTTAMAKPSFVGTWALSEKWCQLWENDKIDDMDAAHSVVAGLMSIYEDGSIEWKAAQSCEANAVTILGDSFNIKAVCEYRGVEDVKATITGTVDGDGMHVNYPKALKDTMWSLYRDYVRCD